jgi:CRISPR-associated protein Cas1
VVIEQDETYNFPIEDISSIILETHRATLTSALLANIAENNIVLFTCDERHLPNGIFIPLNGYCRELGKLKEQMEVSEPFRKRCWQKVIECKIQNQAFCLHYHKKEGREELAALSKQVESGDPGNIEGVAAKQYFGNLFGKGFTRNQPNAINGALDYGYSIVRGIIARELVVHGFEPELGIHHCNDLNRFNLADDFVEPFRPLVDMWVYENIRLDFEKEQKKDILKIISLDLQIKRKKQSLANSIRIMTESFSLACGTKDFGKLELPELAGLNFHRYE